jgi:hypothetical protein
LRFEASLSNYFRRLHPQNNQRFTRMPHLLVSLHTHFVLVRSPKYLTCLLSIVEVFFIITSLFLHLTTRKQSRFSCLVLMNPTNLSWRLLIDFFLSMFVCVCLGMELKPLACSTYTVSLSYTSGL